MNQRRFHRVQSRAPGELSHSGMNYKCRLENVSLRGALISADECIMIPVGDCCTLSVTLEPQAGPVVITACIVHSFFSMVGIKFVSFSGDAEERLLDFLRQSTTEPEKLEQEWEMIQEKRSNLPGECACHASATGS
ncbi:type IV pilus assembly PilZ [Citrifermentans bremense]|uniref:Type IV pilus assembly PilZ n=2 Tax=Citrifermentans bremense TaxID=60035 RepID=A0A6S6LZG0_9BACT|nr:type IV pilus assembly PilZ [Citrifermentans bremense]